VPDSSHLHPDDPQQDGQRHAQACSRDHAWKLVAQGYHHWVDQELWANKLTRVSVHWDQAEATLHDVAARAGLSYPQLLRAIEWCAERPDVQHRDRASTTAWRRAT